MFLAFEIAHTNTANTNEMYNTNIKWQADFDLWRINLRKLDDGGKLLPIAIKYRDRVVVGLTRKGDFVFRRG